MHSLQGLNESQRKAVLAKDRAILVVAGPGTGKTGVIAHRVAFLVGQGIAPAGIAALTFTTRAALEMRQRITGLLGREPAGAFIGTFHSLGLMMLAELSGREVRLCTPDEQAAIVRDLWGLNARGAEAMLRRISLARNGVGGPDGSIGPAVETYEAVLRERGVVDFDDLILLPLRSLVEEGPGGKGRERFAHIVVDEYQDVSPSQNRLLSLLTAGGASVFAVGDADQAIYAFRGADVENFLGFRRAFPSSSTILLRENYRSPEIVLAAAEALIKNNARRVERDLVAVDGPGMPVRIVSVADAAAEAEFIAGQIDAAAGGTSHYRLTQGAFPAEAPSSPFRFSDFAVLFRTNSQARIIERGLTEWGIPCQIAGRGLGAARTAAIGFMRRALDAPEADGRLECLLDEAAKETGFAMRPAFRDTLICAFGDLPFHQAVTAAVNEISLLGEADGFDGLADAVPLMTLHMAKGLEFRVVFIAGAEDGCIPSGRHDGPGVEEERRLFYVGMTRAREALYVLHARTRHMGGENVSVAPSPFLAEIPRGCCQEIHVPDPPRRTEKRERQMTLF